MPATPLALRRHGPTTGTPLVLLHAYPLDSSMWEAVIEVLSESSPWIPIITIDAPGFGASAPWPDVPPSLEAVAESIQEALEGEGVTRAVIAGLSLGGYLALALAERAPGLFAGIGLLDTKAEADEEPARKVRLATATKVLEIGAEAIAGSLQMVLGPTTLAERPEVVEHLRHAIAAAPPEGIAWIQRAMADRPNRLGALEALAIREPAIAALVLRGDEDALASAESAAAMSATLGPGSERTTILGVGHMSANEAPTSVASALTRLYRRSA